MLPKNTSRPGWRRESSSTSGWGQEFQNSEKLRLGAYPPAPIDQTTGATGRCRVCANSSSALSGCSWITRHSEEPLAASNFVRIADKGGQSRRECSSLGATPPWCISPSLSLRHSSCSGHNRIRAFQKRLKMRLSPHSRAEPIFQSPVCMGRPAAAAPC
jgi:hypothetical protein